MSLSINSFRPVFATFCSVALIACLWMVGCAKPADKAPDQPAAGADEHDHDHDGHDHDHDHDGEEHGHSHGDEEKGGEGEEEAPADPGPKVDPAADDVKAGEPSFPKLPE